MKKGAASAKKKRNNLCMTGKLGQKPNLEKREFRNDFPIRNCHSTLFTQYIKVGDYNALTT